MTAKLEIYNAAGDKIATQSAAELETAHQVDQSELDWAIEEHGVCTILNDSGELLFIVAAGDPLPEDAIRG